MFLLSGCTSPSPRTKASSSVQDLVVKIQADMPTTELDRLFGVKGQMGPWSGGTGYLIWTLPSGERVTVSCYSRDGLKHSFVQSDVTVYIYEGPGQQTRRIR